MTDITVESVGAGGSGANVEPRSTGRTPSSLRLVAAVVAAVLVLVVAAAGLSRFGSTPRPEPDGEAAGRESAGLVGDEATSGVAADAGEGAGIPPSDDHLRIDHIAHVFDTAVDTDRARFGIAYLREGNLRVLDARGDSGTEVEIAQGYRQLTGVSMLVGQAGTWAIDERERDRSYLVSSIYEVVDLDRTGTLGVIARRETVTTVDLLADALPYVALDVPVTTEVIGVTGRGLLLFPRSGGTYELRPLMTEPTRIGDDRAIGASPAVTVYETCGPVLDCMTYAVPVAEGDAAGDRAVGERAVGDSGAGPDRIELPVPAGSKVTPSPDGRWLVVETDDGGADEAGHLLLVATQAHFRMEPGPLDVVAWSPDSRFVATLRGDLIDIYFPDADDPTRPRIETIGLASALSDPALVVFQLVE